MPEHTESVATIEPWDEQPVAESDWTKMSLNLSAFQSGQRAATNGEQPEFVPEPPIEFAPEPTAMAEQPAELDAELAVELALAAFDEHVQPEPPAPMLSKFPPPPPTARQHGEFDAPIAPPVTAAGPSRGPVAPTSARSAAARPPASTSQPNLPTRSSGAAADAVDPLIEVGLSQPLSNDARNASPVALQSALAVFEFDPLGSGRLLPNRPRLEDFGFADETPLATAQSRLDPEALRQRLRSFQAEFNSGGASPEPPTDHGDFGGDRR